MRSIALLPLLPILAQSANIDRRDDSTGESIKEGQTYADPPGNVRRLHPYGRSDLCLGPGTVPAKDGVTVGVITCRPNDDTEYGNTQFWQIPAEGSQGQIKLDGTSFCLDAIDMTKQGNAAQLVFCGPQYTQQASYKDGHLQFGGSAKTPIPPVKCLDVEATGDAASGGHPPTTVYRQVNTYTCMPEQKNQLFTLYDGEDHGPGGGGDSAFTTDGTSSTSTDEGSTTLPTGSSSDGTATPTTDAGSTPTVDPGTTLRIGNNDGNATPTTEADAAPTTEPITRSTSGASLTCAVKRAVKARV